MRHLGKIALLSILLGLSDVVMAGSSAGTPTNVGAVDGVVVFTAGTKSGGPTCAVVTQEWAADTTTPTGKAIYALLLTAISSGRNVAVQGAGPGQDNCSAWPDRETATGLWLQ